MRALALVALLLAPGAPLALAAPCLVMSYEDREVAAGHYVAVEQVVCAEESSARHAQGVWVTNGSPRDNTSTTLAQARLDHQRTGDRDGAHGVRERVVVQVGATMLEARYDAARDAEGFTRCRLYVTFSVPRSDGTFDAPLPVCAPMEALLP